MDYKKSHKLRTVGICIGLAFTLLGTFLSSGLVTCIGVLIVAAAGYQKRKFCCCPHCGKPINTRFGLPEYCYECGKKMP